MGGGGGNTTTQVSGVPDWLRPDVQKAFGEATAAYDAGDLSNVAQHSAAQQTFLQDAATGGLGRQRERALSNVAGQQLAGAANTGTLGSARGDRARAAGLADVAANQAQQDFQARNLAFGQLQDQAQKEADARHQGLQRLFGYYGSGAAGSQQTQTGGGGK